LARLAGIDVDLPAWRCVGQVRLVVRLDDRLGSALQKALGRLNHLVGCAAEVVERGMIAVVIRARMVMNSRRRRSIAAPQTTDPADRRFVSRNFCRQALLQIGDHLMRAAKLTTHVAADVHLDLRRSCFAIVRKKTDDFLKPVERNGESLGQRDECFTRQITVAALDLMELLSTHRAPRAASSRWSASLTGLICRASEP